MTRIRSLLRRLLPERVGGAALADLDRELAERPAGVESTLWYAWEGAKLVVHLRTAAALDAARGDLAITTLAVVVLVATTTATIASSTHVQSGTVPREGVLIIGLQADDTAALHTVDELGLFRSAAAPSDPSRSGRDRVAEISAGGLRVAGVPPLVGRLLRASDERDGARPVVVIGYDVWRTRFRGARAIVGREILVNGAPYTVVGVMPEGFAFPLDHEYWVPLRARPGHGEVEPMRLASADLLLVGRLAPGATVEHARAEVASLGLRTAAVPRLRVHPLPTLAPPPDAWSARFWGVVLKRYMLSMAMGWP